MQLVQLHVAVHPCVCVHDLCCLCASSLPGTNSSSSDLGVMMGVGGVTLMSGAELPCSSMAGGNVSTPVLVFSDTVASSVSIVLLWWVWSSSGKTGSSISVAVLVAGVKDRMVGLVFISKTGIPLTGADI